MKFRYLAGQKLAGCRAVLHKADIDLLSKCLLFIFVTIEGNVYHYMLRLNINDIEVAY